jgi:hypothetical protein
MLDRTPYLPVVKKGWNALANAITAQGHLGWVQAIGGAPGNTSAAGTAAYGDGALMLAGRKSQRCTDLLVIAFRYALTRKRTSSPPFSLHES